MNRGRLAGLVAAVILTVVTGILIAQTSNATSAMRDQSIAPVPSGSFAALIAGR